ncbi:MAG: hypothetical protein JO345_08330 [Streptosporangiaceae bacterium]|nr:hypothetical protein [Streptosporangiaceae bacterium]
MVRHDTPSRDNRTAAQSYDKVADAATRNRDGHHHEHNPRDDRSGHGTHPDNPRSADGHRQDERTVREAVPDGAADHPDRRNGTGQTADTHRRPDNANSNEQAPRYADEASATASAADHQQGRGGNRENGDGWPSQGDLDLWHGMYQEFRQQQETSSNGWDRGTNVVDDKPDRSPGDISDLPPTGERLLELEPKESRATAFRRETYDHDVVEGVHDTIEQNANDLQKLFDRPPTTSHADVPASTPQIGLPELEHATANDLTLGGLMLGMLIFEGGRWCRNKLEQLRGR